MGQVECDDGNIDGGDGCSAKCEVENGFKCFSVPSKPDVCIDVQPPTGILTVRKDSTLDIMFSEKVVSSVNSIYHHDKLIGTSLAKTMIVKLEDMKTACGMTWQLVNRFESFTKFDTLRIKINVTCSLRANAQRFVVNFTDDSIIMDPAGNRLASTVLYARTVRYIYISDTEKAAVESTGTAFSSSSLLTLLLMLGISLFQSATIGSFWAFVNMLQILSYLPMMGCIIPYNLELFLTEYLTVKKMVFPFHLIPGIPFNPFSAFADFITKPLNDRFALSGYETLSFLFNFADELMTWLILLGVYLLLAMLTSILPKDV